MSSNGRDLAPREANAEATRRAIIAAARHAFARDGYDNTALDSIVAPVRLTKGALYHHFKNKAAVLEAVYVELEQALASRVTAAVMACAGGAWERMVAAIDAFFEASSDPEYVRIVLRDAPHVLGPAHGRELDHAIGLGLVIQLVSDLTEAGAIAATPVVTTARMLLAAASEVAVAMAYDDDPARIRREGTAVLIAMLSGLR